ncbi:hypothetical protein AAKU55_005280 [Oxalobacteraceae bacterium GrIS 1.11]
MSQAPQKAHTPTPSVDALMKQAFDGPRDPRSAEYKAGVRAVLEMKIEGKAIQHAYAPGTAQEDAFYAGHAEGVLIWRNVQAKAARKA